MSNEVCAIVLAAGQGSRYRAVAGNDQHKLLAHCLGLDGVVRPVLEQVLIGLSGVVDKCLLITRTDCPEISRLGLYYGCEVVLLDSPGMGDSIAAAVAVEPDCRGWLVVLGDMPFILPETLSNVVASLREDCISVPLHQGVRGHPVGFGRELGPALMTLTGDQGAKRLFKTSRVQLIEVDDPGVLWDVDTPEALIFKP
ncbi:molybdopterin-guanine dinucleotide biosynthesis protein MobA [Pseudomonas syringae]|uniref:Molybdopterin-guanine dinucleotide biosynthesis protein MobA n=1 Tax=Pseudomonas syringae TaxID=317 RepID=A0A1C7Z3Z6_PSESX|nr:nucleotidyltransferase family protein [Pseudomonas syringae]OCR24774.1 molybdopterin-guanine dinucleotide biosynthesis protein MobA [Pseudomonas syringae]